MQFEKREKHPWTGISFIKVSPIVDVRLGSKYKYAYEIYFVLLKYMKQKNILNNTNPKLLYN